MISAIILSLFIGAALGAVAMGLIKDNQCEHLLTENKAMYEAVQATAAENERLRAITEQPEGACVQLAQMGNASSVMH